MSGQIARRRLIIGGAAGALLSSMPSGIGEAAMWIIPKADCRRKAQLVFFPAFFAGLASGYLLEILKNHGLIPGAQASTLSQSVQAHHGQEYADLSNQGYG